MKPFWVVLFVVAAICLLAGLSLEWTGVNAVEAAKTVALADTYRNRPGNRIAAEFFYREAVRMYPNTPSAWEARLKVALFYDYNPWAEPVRRPIHRTPLGKEE